MKPIDWFEEYLLECGSTKVGSMFQCPSHDDSYPSLSVQEGDGNRVLIYCHAGCQLDEILEALQLNARRLFETHFLNPKQFYKQLSAKPLFEPFEWKHGSNRRYDARMKWGSSSVISTQYHQYSQEYRLKRLRHSDGRKQCIWEHLYGGRWVQGGVRGSLHKLPLYQHLLVKTAIEEGVRVVLCESESSVDALIERNIVATTWAGGSAKPQIDKLKSALAKADVLYIADNDAPGLRCLAKLESGLKPYLGYWEILMGLPGQDARDLLLQGSLEHLRLPALPEN